MTLEYVSVDYLLDPSSDEEVTRAGVIPYAVKNREELWLLGTLVKSGRLSDFGGSCYSVSKEDPLACLLREVNEESNGLLVEPIERSIYEEGWGLHIWRWANQQTKGRFQYLAFVEVDYDEVTELIANFKPNEENAAINWYSKEEIIRDYRINDFNTSIHNFMRRFGVKTR